MDYTIYFLDKNGEEQELELEISYTISNDGIGPYEYWGQRCIDKGFDYAEIEEVKYNKNNFTEAEMKEIEKVIEKQIEQIQQACMQDAAFAKERDDEKEFDSWKDLN